MLIVISPAKTLDYESPPTTARHSLPDFVSESAELVERMREFSPPDIERLMHISPKLADLNFGRLLNWSAKEISTENARQAILAFKGDVYTGMQAETFSEADLGFAQEHLRILSGLYGVLKPLDLMQPYRLEMGTKLDNSRGKNLYEFWGDKPAEALNAQMSATAADVLVNLASDEYFKSVNRKALNAEVVTPIFKDYKNGTYKVVSFFAKKARGQMAAWIIRNRIEDSPRLTGFDGGGYRYDEATANGSELVFLRDGQ